MTVHARGIQAESNDPLWVRTMVISISVAFVALMLVLPLGVIFFRNDAEPWVFMWLLAFAIYMGCKWLTFLDALGAGVIAPMRARLAYLFLWPGMSLKEADCETLPACDEQGQGPSEHHSKGVP